MFIEHDGLLKKPFFCTLMQLSPAPCKRIVCYSTIHHKIFDCKRKTEKLRSKGHQRYKEDIKDLCLNKVSQETREVLIENQR